MMNDYQRDRGATGAHGSTDATTATTYADLLRRNVKAMRARHGINQETLASRMRAFGFDVWVRQTVASVEGGKRRLTAEEVFGLAAVLHVPIMHLMTPVGCGELVALGNGVEWPIEDVRELVQWGGRLRRILPDGLTLPWRDRPERRARPRPDWRGSGGRRALGRLGRGVEPAAVEPVAVELVTGGGRDHGR